MDKDSKTKRVQRMVLEYLSRQTEPRTSTEIVEVPGLARLSVLPTMHRMRVDYDKRWTAIVGKRVNPTSGRTQVAYVISSKGIRHLATLSNARHAPAAKREAQEDVTS
jgi:hypothetical protein